MITFTCVNYWIGSPVLVNSDLFTCVLVVWISARGYGLLLLPALFHFVCSAPSNIPLPVGIVEVIWLYDWFYLLPRTWQMSVKWVLAFSDWCEQKISMLQIRILLDLITLYYILTLYYNIISSTISAVPCSTDVSIDIINVQSFTYVSLAQLSES